MMTIYSCPSNWVRRTARVKRIDTKRMEEPSEEVGVKESFTRTREEPAKVGWTYGKNGGERLRKRADG